jgi:hypothetical protein
MRLTLSVLCVAMTAAIPALAGPPETLHFQGYLTNDSGGPLNGTFSITFGFYDADNGGQPLWSEKQEVDVVTGVFQVLLGGSAQNPLDPALFETGGMYLGLTLWEGEQPLELLPRQAVVSNPYAFFSAHADQCTQAQNAESLGGQGADEFVSVAKVDEVCLTKTNVEQWLIDNGYGPGGDCTCQWADLKDIPDALVYEDELGNALAGYYDITDIDVMLGSFYTKAAVDGLVAGLAPKNHNHDGVYMADDKGAVNQATDSDLAFPTYVKNLDADLVDGKHASDFALAPSAPNPYLESDSDWFTFPNKTSLPITVSASGADFLFVVVRSTEQGAQVTTPVMGANSDSYAAAYAAFDGKVATLRTEAYVAAINSAGDGQNLLLNNGLGRIFSFKKAADFNSGWQTCAAGNTYVHQHNLGQLPTIAYLEAAQNADGTGWLIPAMGSYHQNYTNGTGVYDINESWITVKGGSANVADFVDANGAGQSPTSGYVRVLAWK